MTIEERLCFIRAGYSAQDIAAFEAAEDKPADPADEPAGDPAPADDPAVDPAGEPADPADEPAGDPAPADDPAVDPAPAEDIPAWAKALKASLDEVKKAIQSDNRRFEDMGDDNSVEDAAENALAKYITGKVPEKSTHGGKRK